MRKNNYFNFFIEFTKIFNLNQIVFLGIILIISLKPVLNHYEKSLHFIRLVFLYVLCTRSKYARRYLYSLCAR